MQHFDNFMQQIYSIMLQKKIFLDEHPFWFYSPYKTAPIPKFSRFAPKLNPLLTTAWTNVRSSQLAKCKSTIE